LRDQPGRACGGGRDNIAAALRIVLSRYLPELPNVHESIFLIFDEIFGRPDEERRNNLLAALRTQESRFPPIPFISAVVEIQAGLRICPLSRSVATGRAG
jgi:DNA repair exonuclease SbcCD ATPase subunit